MKTTKFSNIYGGDFQINGYSMDIYINGKFVGNRTLQQPDRTKMGWYGRKTQILDDDLLITHKNGTKINLLIRKGTEILTEIFPICGRLQ